MDDTALTLSSSLVEQNFLEVGMKWGSCFEVFE
jgi:hypothetical protein